MPRKLKSDPISLALPDKRIIKATGARTLPGLCTKFPASSNVVVLPSTSKQSFLIVVGVGDAASGYCLGSMSCRCFGGFNSKGGKLVVVVVVVVTTIVCVAEIWPTTACGLTVSCRRAVT